jgi:hypothetical protein
MVGAERRPDARYGAGRPAVPRREQIALDPITCWWKTDTNAVHLGERFTLTLTCGLADTGRVTVVPDVKSLEPTTVQACTV